MGLHVGILAALVTRWPRREQPTAPAFSSAQWIDVVVDDVQPGDAQVPKPHVQVGQRKGRGAARGAPRRVAGTGRAVSTAVSPGLEFRGQLPGLVSSLTSSAVPDVPRDDLAPQARSRLESGGFSAHIEEDGRLRFEDKPAFSLGLRPPCNECKAKLKRYIADPVSAPTIGFMDLLPINPRFDVTDTLMRAVDDDPYAAEKLKVADATRAARMDTAKEYRARTERAELFELRQRLERLWAHPAPEAVRRALLFQLWDECDDNEAGVTARQTIYGFIRRTRIPFPVEEVARFNQTRTSREAFAP